MKLAITLYALSMLAVIGIGLYHAPWWLLALLVGPALGVIAAGLLDDYRRALQRRGVL